MKDRFELGRQLISNQLKAVKFKLKYKRLQKKSLADLQTFTILEECGLENVSTSPKYNNACNQQLTYPEVAIKLYQLKDVYCNIEGANFVTEDLKYVFIEEFPYISCEDANYKAGLVVRHDTQFAYIKNIKKSQVRRFDSVFFLGVNGSFNFYHWMIELGPKLLLITNEMLQEKGIDTIVVHKCVQKIDNYQWLLTQCSKHLPSAKIVYVDANDILFAENLLFINTFNQTLYHQRKGVDGYQTTTIFNCSNIDAYRQLLKCAADKLTTTPVTGNIGNSLNQLDIKYNKIFVLRNEDSVSRYNNRRYNQQEVFSFFKKEGFIGVYPDQLSLSEQIQLFQNADFIVGPTGASWSNLIFASKGMKAISWLPSQLQYFDTYCSLANLLGVDMRFLQYKTENEDIHSAYQLDLNEVIELYKQMK
ncbi:glycosyltransferase family 61 protein [Psychrobacter lutiphocae]|uniref:glycosyltransferase family 61 protein n=1 Tax=Psychrobacter lutiphocae TaxID=540500 RepID=UPI00191B5D94|nr:glycosyltransferase family 61 protein [Psychrobacter lutiphocae]